PGEADKMSCVAEGFGADVETLVGATTLGALLGVLRRSALMLGNDSGPRHLAGAVDTSTAAAFTYANLADVAPLSRTWHRVAVSWHGGCAVCGRRVLEGWCGHGASATGDGPGERLSAMAHELWDQVLAAGRASRDVEVPAEVGAA
ncbi:MAG: hypothetical protein M3P93_14605, partial [Actinomycetota bacterium]|nr:hypothetical protein [Actinomycetota bacterium]